MSSNACRSIAMLAYPTPSAYIVTQSHGRMIWHEETLRGTKRQGEAGMTAYVRNYIVFKMTPLTAWCMSLDRTPLSHQDELGLLWCLWVGSSHGLFFIFCF